MFSRDTRIWIRGDPYTRARAVLRATTRDEVEMAYFGRTFDRSPERAVMRRRLQWLLESALGQEPPGVVARIQADIGVLEMSLDHRELAAKFLVDSIAQSIDGSDEDIFEVTLMLAGPGLGYAVATADQDTAFRMSIYPGMKRYQLEHGEAAHSPDARQATGIAIAVLGIMNLAANARALGGVDREHPFAQMPLQNARTLDQMTDHNLSFVEWLEERLTGR